MIVLTKNYSIRTESELVPQALITAPGHSVQRFHGTDIEKQCIVSFETDEAKSSPATR